MSDASERPVRWTDLANPTTFLTLSGRALPWMAAASAAILLVGLYLSFAAPDKFTLLSGGDSLSDYQFNKHVIHHLHCATCGVESFARGRRPAGGNLFIQP